MVGYEGFTIPHLGFGANRSVNLTGMPGRLKLAKGKIWTRQLKGSF
jgi:hypothetical protein